MATPQANLQRFLGLRPGMTNLRTSGNAMRLVSPKHPYRGAVRHNYPGNESKLHRGCAIADFRLTIGMYFESAASFHVEVANERN
jgi:hypothetical protein